MAYTFTQWSDQVAKDIQELCGDALHLMDANPLACGYHQAYQAGITAREIAEETIRFARAYTSN